MFRSFGRSRDRERTKIAEDEVELTVGDQVDRGTELAGESETSAEVTAVSDGLEVLGDLRGGQLMSVRGEVPEGEWSTGNSSRVRERHSDSCRAAEGEDTAAG